MANARTLPLALARMFNTGFASVKDPGDGETISWTNQGLAIARIVTAGAESRALPSFSSGKFGIGTFWWWCWTPTAAI